MAQSLNVNASSSIIREQTITIEIDPQSIEADVEIVKVVIVPSSGRSRTLTFPADMFNNLHNDTRGRW